MDEAALGGFEVGGREGVGEAAELEAADAGEGVGGHDDWEGLVGVLWGGGKGGRTDSVPAAGNRHGLGFDHGVPGLGRAEVGPLLRDVLVAAGVAEGEGVVEEGRFAEVEGACSRVMAVVGLQEGENVGDL